MNPLGKYRYCWPDDDLARKPCWRREGEYLVRDLPETSAELQADSRWPAFFPAPISLVTTADGQGTALERVVGASIVNRFPYVLALSVCRLPLSARHHQRRRFMSVLENGGRAAVQFLPPGPALDRALAATALPDEQSGMRIAHSRLPCRPGATDNRQHGSLPPRGGGLGWGVPVFTDAYLVYEGALVRPGRDFDGRAIFPQPWRDVGSHRVYFLEIRAIQLRRDIALGSCQVAWTGLPSWHLPGDRGLAAVSCPARTGRYTKGYTPHYRFPAPSTVAFEADAYRHGMALRELPDSPRAQVEVDNDRARWPCFFPSSVGMITTWTDDGRANLMPCGSTSIVSRHPLTVACCVSYAPINERYAPRATLELIRSRGRFGCGVPFVHDSVVSAIRYAGNVSHADDAGKVAHAGLEVEDGGPVPVLSALPIHFDCRVTAAQPLGTHVMFLGEVERIRVRREVAPDNPLTWVPFPALEQAHASEPRAVA